MALEKSNYSRANLRSKGQRSRSLTSWQRKCKNRFSRISYSKVDQFPSNKTKMINGQFYIVE